MKISVIFTISILVVIVFASLFSFFVIINKNDLGKTISTVRVLGSADESKAVTLIKNNIVKISNTINQSKIIGTGFFHESGYLVTNSHVVDIKGDIIITYPDGNKSMAKLVANDIASDVALLYVENPKVLALLFGSTISLKEPETVISIGYAFDLAGDATVTKGAFSARRSLGSIDFLQSDAAVNPGNSGSPLIDTRGYLIGMNSLSNENATINLSISSESLNVIIDKLLNDMDVTYIKGTRPENYLNRILFEVGFEISDIYNEDQYMIEDLESFVSEDKSVDPTETPVIVTDSPTPIETLSAPSKEPISQIEDTPDGCLNYQRYKEYINGMSEANAKAEILSKGFTYVAYHIYYPNRSKTGLLSMGAADLSFVNSDGELYFEGDGQSYIEIGIGTFIFYYNVATLEEADIDPEQIRKLQGQTEEAAITVILNLGLTYNVNYSYLDLSNTDIGVVYEVKYDTDFEYLPRGSKVELYVYKESISEP